MNRRLFRATGSIAGALFLCHCGNDNGGAAGGPSDGRQETAASLQTEQVAPRNGEGADAGNPGCASGCTGTRDYDAQSYSLRAKFDWTAQRLIAEEDICLVLTNSPSTKPPLTEPAASVVALDAAVDVKRVSAHGKDLPWAYDASKKVLHVDVSALRRSAGAVSFTVNYEAATSSALTATQGRDGDPVTSRVVNTDSEPNRGRTWLISNDHPSDRALWSVELTAAPDEDVIANGERVRDEVKDGARIVGYHLDTPLPTYLMAFAVGQLEHRNRARGRVPLGVWYRRGLMVDAEANFDMLEDQMGTFEKLLGPYPFHSYAVVILPGSNGAEENATVTFSTEAYNQEDVSRGSFNFAINAHELAHHWFGDWVTIRDYDDLWFKEGMAELMAAEASRTSRDGEGKGRLFGQDFYFLPDDAIVDKSLAPQDKGTSGPYERSAWVITQIRARIGEDAFWRSLRGLLKTHAKGTINGEEFVRSFAPALDEGTIRKILASLEKKPVPAVAIEAPESDAGTQTPVKLSLTDPSAQLLDPLDVAVIDAEGKETQPQKLAPGGSVSMTIPAGGYLTYDEREIHPPWDGSFDIDFDAYYGRLVPLMIPGTTAARAAFDTRSAAVQERIATLAYSLPAFIAPGELGDRVAALDSNRAQFGFEDAACQWLHDVVAAGGDPAAWASAIEPIAKHPAIPMYSSGQAACGAALPSKWFGHELDVPIDAKNAARVGYLLGFDYGVDASFDFGLRVATQAPSVALRDEAIQRLASQSVQGPYTPVPPERAPQWKAFFRARLAELTTFRRFRTVWKGVTGFSDDLALGLAGQKLHLPDLPATFQRQVACDANQIAQARPAAWNEFKEGAKPWDTLAPEAVAVLQDPATCTALTMTPQRDASVAIGRR